MLGNWIRNNSWGNTSTDWYKSSDWTSWWTSGSSWSEWSNDNDERWRGQQTGDTYAVPGEAIDSPVVDTITLKACCFQKEAGAQFLMAKGRSASIESMVVTTFQNGEGLDTEVYAKLEGRVFLFRREPETKDKQIIIRGWHDF